MKYIYTMPDCPRCDVLKKRYIEDGIMFTERNADRMKSPEDTIDTEALIQASMQNMELPVIVEG